MSKPRGYVIYRVGASKFRDKANAEQAEANRAKFAAVVNPAPSDARKGMTAEERAAAFVAFFAKAGMV